MHVQHQLDLAIGCFKLQNMKCCKKRIDQIVLFLLFKITLLLVFHFVFIWLDLAIGFLNCENLTFEKKEFTKFYCVEILFPFKIALLIIFHFQDFPMQIPLNFIISKSEGHWKMQKILPFLISILYSIKVTKQIRTIL